ncbi:MAG: heme exporter protein CcmB [Rickettsiales bacterium]
MLSAIQHDIKYYIKNLAEAIYIYVFFIAIMALFVFAAPKGELAELAPTALWLGLAFSMLLTAPQMLARDAEQGMFDYWRLLPVAMEWLVLSRFIACFLIQMLPLIALVPVAGVLLGVPQAEWCEQAVILAIGAVPLLALMLMASAMMVGLSQHGGLIALIILPLMIPLIIFGVGAMNGAIEQPMTLLIALSAMSLPLSIVVTAACLRVSE